MASRRPTPSESTRNLPHTESRDQRFGEVPFQDEVEEQLLTVGLESMEATIRGLLLDLEQDEVVMASASAGSGPSDSETPSSTSAADLHNGKLSDIYLTL